LKQTDRRQTKEWLNASALWGWWRHNKVEHDVIRYIPLPFVQLFLPQQYDYELNSYTYATT